MVRGRDCIGRSSMGQRKGVENEEQLSVDHESRHGHQVAKVSKSRDQGEVSQWQQNSEVEILFYFINYSTIPLQFTFINITSGRECFCLFSIQLN